MTTFYENFQKLPNDTSSIIKRMYLVAEFPTITSSRPTHIYGNHTNISFKVGEGVQQRWTFHYEHNSYENIHKLSLSIMGPALYKISTINFMSNNANKIITIESALEPYAYKGTDANNLKEIKAFIYILKNFIYTTQSTGFNEIKKIPVEWTIKSNNGINHIKELSLAELLAKLEIIDSIKSHRVKDVYSYPIYGDD